MARREDAPPHVDMFEGSENLDEKDEDESEEDGDESEEDDESEEEDEGDDEPPPPMNDSSGSDADSIEPPPFKVYDMRNAEGKWTKTTTVSGNLEGSKTSKQAPTRKVQKPAASSTAAAAGKGEEDSIWNQFHKYCAGLIHMNRLGIVALKQWESFSRRESIRPNFLSWYENQVKRNRSVPQAMAVEGLPSGFPEFCHWIDEGHYKPSAAASLEAGFQQMAVQHVKEVKLALDAGAGPQLPADKSATVESLKLRKRERRLGRKGSGSTANEELVVRMTKTLADLETITAKEPGEDGGVKASMGRALRAGLDAEEEMRKKMMSAGAVERDGDDREVSLENRYKDLTPSVCKVLEGLMRAKTYRQRAERNLDLLEAEMRWCFSRMARMEAQYQTLVAEMSAPESFRDALASAELLIDQAGKCVNADAAVRALGELNLAVKMLEVHVSDYFPESKESEELVRGRQALGLALCNRSLANLRVGNAYNAKDDAKRAVDVWPHEISKGHLDRCLAHLSREGAQIKHPNWKAYVGPS